jgi:hypothetical protein
MAYEFKFIDDPHISVVTFSGQVTPQDVEEESALSLEALERCTGKYYPIVDISAHPNFTFNVLKVGTIFKVIRHERFGYGVIIGVSALANFWLQLLGQTSTLRFKTFPTLEEGIAFIEGLRRAESEKIAQ